MVHLPLFFFSTSFKAALSYPIVCLFSSWDNITQCYLTLTLPEQQQLLQSQQVLYLWITELQEFIQIFPKEAYKVLRLACQYAFMHN